MLSVNLINKVLIMQLIPSYPAKIGTPKKLDIQWSKKTPSKTNTTLILVDKQAH